LILQSFLLPQIINILHYKEFCKQFNERSEKMYKKDTPLSVELNAMSDRSFTFDIRSPPTSYLILQAAGVQKGASNPNAESPIGYITPEQVYEIARIKQRDEMRFHLPLESIARSVVGSAKTMGVAVREEQEEDDDESSTHSKGNLKIIDAETDLEKLGY
jgi:large subunit ribosomal protein L11